MHGKGTNVKKILLGLISLTLLLVSAEVKRGDIGILTEEWKWIEVKNPDGIKSGNNFFHYNDSCGVRSGKKVRVIAIQDDKLLLRYSYPGTVNGTLCPTGTIYFIKKDKWRSLSVSKKLLEQREQKIQAEKDWIKKQISPKKEK